MFYWCKKKWTWKINLRNVSSTVNCVIWHAKMRQKCFRTLFSCFRTSFNFQKLFRDNMYLHSNELLNLTVARKKKKFEKIKNLKKKFKKFFEKKIFCVNCHGHKSASIVMYNQSVSNDIFFNLRQMPCKKCTASKAILR